MRADELFEILASATWRTIVRAKKNRISFGEDAITSINLNAIASLKGCVAVEDTRATEAHKGCDFEMWIGSANNGWYRYAVQAKKINLNGLRYEKLKHKVRGRDQIDILKEYAARARAAPTFCFYNYAPAVAVFNCKRDHDLTQLGCMILPAAVVEDAINAHGHRNFGWLHRQPEAIPWRCLITCPSLCHRDENSRESIRQKPSFWYDRLPIDVQALFERVGVVKGEGLTDQSEVPSDGSADALYPAWRVVVDTGDDPEGRSIRDEPHNLRPWHSIG